MAMEALASCATGAGISGVFWFALGSLAWATYNSPHRGDSSDWLFDPFHIGFTAIPQSLIAACLIFGGKKKTPNDKWTGAGVLLIPILLFVRHLILRRHIK